MRGYTPPDDTELAAVLGIEELRPGRQYTRDKNRVAVASVWVDAVWILCVNPSFHQGGLVGVATARGEELRDETSPGWIRGVLASGGSIWTCELAADPLPELLAHVRLLDTHDDGLSLDGIGYELRTETLTIRATVTFGSPMIAALVDVEVGAFGLAKQLAEKSGNQSLLTFVGNWGEYVGGGA